MTFPLLSYRSNVLPVVHGGVLFSIQRSGIANGFTHVIALAGDASAVAVAAMSTVGTSSSGPMSVSTGFPRAVLRYTFTATRLLPVGPTGNVTSLGRTEGAAPTTVFAIAAFLAFITAGPPGDLSSKLSNASAV